MKPTLNQLSQALHESWAQDTCYEGSDWTPDNPARGQCVVSSLIVQDYFGGDLVRYAVTGEGLDEKHYGNLIEGTVIDTTVQQYRQPVVFKPLPIALKGFASTREKRLADKDTKDRYDLLRARVASSLSNMMKRTDM